MYILSPLLLIIQQMQYYLNISITNFYITPYLSQTNVTWPFQKITIMYKLDRSFKRWKYKLTFLLQIYFVLHGFHFPHSVYNYIFIYFNSQI